MGVGVAEPDGNAALAVLPRLPPVVIRAHRSGPPSLRAARPLRPHTPEPEKPAVCPQGRTVLYVGEDLATSACEVFGESRAARLCPQYRVALLRPTRPIAVQDLITAGAAMSIGALPALADGDLARQLTQEWARAILEDAPSGPVRGIAYRSAYNGGQSLALWNCEDSVETLTSGGVAQDYALASPEMYGRLLAALRGRHIDVNRVSSEDCKHCS